MADLPVPSWFKYLQGVAEPAGDRCFRLSTPLVRESFIRIESKNGHWLASVSGSADGAAIGNTEPVFDSERDAWNAAFELYRAEKVY